MSLNYFTTLPKNQQMVPSLPIGKINDLNSRVKSLETETTIRSVGISLDGGGSAPSTGFKGTITVPFAGTITAWNITSDGSSPTCTFDIWKIATGTAIPTVANTITAAAKPALSTGNAVRSTTLTGWTTAVAVDDIIAFSLNSVTSGTLITLVVEITT